MKPSQLLTLLSHSIQARLPVLIVGAPGVGKTSIVEQAAEVAGCDLVVSHPAVADPTDAKGFPWAEKGAKNATFLPFGETARVLESTEPTVWFLDDLGQATPAVQASYMPWLLARRVNGHELPEHVTLLAATNRRTDRAGVTGVLEPVKSRFTTIVELAADLDEWCQWALQQSFIPPEQVAFLRFKPELLCAFEATADLVNSPVPRTWENAGRILSAGLPKLVEQEALAGAVGAGAATELLSFVRMFRELPSVDGILMDPDAGEIPTQTSVLYAVCTALASRATEENFGRVARYAERLYDAGHGDFAALTLRDSARRTPEVLQTPAFVQLASGELGQLIGGVQK